jgi:hypothetical protein
VVASPIFNHGTPQPGPVVAWPGFTGPTSVTGQVSRALYFPGNGATKVVVPSTSDLNLSYFQVAFRCPDVSGVQFYVSLDLRRSELGSNLMVRCPVTYASPTAAVTGSVSPSLGSGTAFSARGAVSFSGGSFAGLTAPTGPGREVGVFGDSGGTPYFGRTGLVKVV